MSGRTATIRPRVRTYDQPFNLVYWRITHEHRTAVAFDDIAARTVVHSSWECREWNLWQDRLPSGGFE